MKKGIEVEGRYRGLPTFFILNEKDLDLISTQVLHFLIDFKNVRHINIYDLDGKFIFDKRLKELSEYYTITLESKLAPEKIPKYISHFVLQIDNDSFQHLRGVDSIKFVDKEINVRMVCIENMNVTFNFEMENDVEL